MNTTNAKVMAISKDGSIIHPVDLTNIELVFLFQNKKAMNIYCIKETFKSSDKMTFLS